MPGWRPMDSAKAVTASSGNRERRSAKNARYGRAGTSRSDAQRSACLSRGFAEGAMSPVSSMNEPSCPRTRWASSCISVGPLQARHDDAPHAKREQSTRHLAHLLRPLRQLQDAGDAGLELRAIVDACRLLRSEDLDAAGPRVEPALVWRARGRAPEVGGLRQRLIEASQIQELEHIALEYILVRRVLHPPSLGDLAHWRDCVQLAAPRDFVARLLLSRQLQTVGGLKVGPELRRRAERLRKLDGRVGRDLLLALHDLVDDLRRPVNDACQVLLRPAALLQFTAQDATRRHRACRPALPLCHHALTSLCDGSRRSRRSRCRCPARHASL